jgi:hypothetical protein
VWVIEIIDPVNIALHAFGYRPTVCKKSGATADRSEVWVSIERRNLMVQSTG